MMRIYKIFGIKQDIDSLETVVDVKKNRWNVKQSGVFKQKKSTTVPNENTYSLLLSNLFTGSCL